MTEYQWEAGDNEPYSKGEEVFVGRGRVLGKIHSRTVTANGSKVYGIRFPTDNPTIILRRQRFSEEVDCYCEADDMEGMML